ncbi:MAG: hypothetical protein HND27_02960 [Bacteroidetes bacterium]|nr:hypothetical protein [Flavobacteriales bacterium]NOG94720.1 hypothetical protein [Bacteroidota bacterium]WKZ75760.1 MAG: hypothetical protein QY303_02465 [Vicingaceae bacterium]MCL4817302.1 hypothetical protein [Flavobacteriales bacterium]CAG0989477.1 hypothetical protein FLAV_02221 [Flavobacteriales bacterium]
MFRWSILYFSFFSLLIALIGGCGKKFSSNSEGVIEFEVTYPKMDPSHFMLDFLPKSMEQRFKNNTFITELSAGMGMFRTCFIIDCNDKKFTHFVKLINKKYILTLNEEGVNEMNQIMPTYIVTPSSETKEIAGYLCKKATVTVENSGEVFDIFYTDEIDIDEPNWATQYSEIKGVLMEYQLEKYGLCMRITAKNVSFGSVEDNSLKQPEGYQHVSIDRMDKEMEEIFESFNQ